ncbi:MAG TPA: sulfatase [Terriglobia bacterium]|nr:sulfatase [Terriglobia bacterium]
MKSATEIPRAPSRWLPAWRFALVFALVGLGIGVVEAALLYFIPRATGLIQPDVEYVIWFLAPIVDLLAGALTGLILGLLCVSKKHVPLMTAVLVSAGLALAGAYLFWMLDWFRIGTGILFPRRLVASTAVEFFLIIFVIALVPARVVSNHVDHFFKSEQWFSRRRGLEFHAIVLAILAGGIVFYATHRPMNYAAMQNKGGPSRAAASTLPNIALIVLDTVRADHFSCYGYSRPTTPYLCALAGQGVLFQNAIAPSSWTLPSVTSIFTGLMPHQTGVDWGKALDTAPWTIAKILQSKGYETAGFNSNPFYGLAGWRLNEGFDFYDDDSLSIRHNLAVTFLGQSILQTLYNRVVRYNQFDHRNADDLNHDVKRWARRRDISNPYFLFINYMDAHRPYLPPAQFDHRFGRIPPRLFPRVTAALNDGHPLLAYTHEERANLIAGYDNSLAYLDSRVGNLIDFLRTQPGGRQTIFIITSDHGEGFGEHGTYDHGWNLYREVLHVPLIIAGPAIPIDMSVSSFVPTRDIFSTVVDLALGLKGAVASTSLRRFWQPESTPPAASSGVISELDVFSQGADPAALSLTTPEWHLIINPGGQLELYNIRSDPGEQSNLASDPGLQITVTQLRANLQARLAYSLLPWRGLAYLSPLNRAGSDFIRQVSQKQLRLPTENIMPIGSAQAVFSHQPPSQLVHPSPSEQQTLRSLPYH